MRQTITHQWQQRKAARVVRVRVVRARHSWETTFRQAETITDYEGQFEIEIDAEAIGKMLATQAARNKSGKSAYLQGMVRGRLLKAKVLKTEQTEYPLPEGYEIIKEEGKADA